MNNDIKEFQFLINRSNYLYHKYKKEPIYLNALLIKRINDKIIDFLLNKGYNIDQNNEINLILDHFEIWDIQFSQHEKNVFSLIDEFIFERIDQATAYPDVEIRNILEPNS